MIIYQPFGTIIIALFTSSFQENNVYDSNFMVLVMVRNEKPGRFFTHFLSVYLKLLNSNLFTNRLNPGTHFLSVFNNLQCTER